MKFTCEKVLLQNAISTAGRAVAQKSSIPALEGILIRASGQELIFSGYNMQTGIRTRLSANVVEEGEIVVSSRLFSEIIRKMPDDVVTFSVSERMTVHLSCGAADFEISGLSAAEYPDLPEVEDEYSIRMDRKILKEMIEEVAFAVSTNESRPIHTGALFEVADNSLTMAAVDGFRLAVRREPLEKAEGGEFFFVAPGQALNEVKGICGESKSGGDEETAASVTLGKRHILFAVGNTELICRRLEGEFLDYRNAIPKNNPISVTVETKDLIGSIDRVSVMISEKLKSPVRCVFDHDKIRLSARTATGDAKDICSMAGDGGGLEIGFNNRYLMEALRYAPADKVRIELNTSVSPALILPVEDDGKFLYMVLPVRLKAN
ncbi:MAG: DNA polymerase III subunit beta [Oscillibacter sp.]|jgi:DNA polymerase-3 subunit beta|nr:DNA polymerase III subunit beta [Oscillibacter sp.]